MPKNNNQDIRRSAAMLARAVEGEGNERVFRISFSSEEPDVFLWGTEIMDHSAGAADLQRINELGVVLFNHDRNRVVGKVRRAWIENGRGEAEIEFDTDAESEVIFQKVKNGTLKGVSVRAHVTNWEDVARGEMSSDGRFAGPCAIARKWEAIEISIASLPADATVGVERSADENDAPEEGAEDLVTRSYRERVIQILELQGGTQH